MNIKLKITFLIVVILTTLLITDINILAQEGVRTLEGKAKQELFYTDRQFIGETGLGQTSAATIVSYIIKILLSFLGVLFVVLIIYAGFTWLTSAGNEEKIEKAKKIMVSAIIGLVIVLAAYVITYFVIDKLLEATKGGAGLDEAGWGYYRGYR